MSSAPLLNDIKAAYEQAYGGPPPQAEQGHSSRIRHDGGSDHNHNSSTNNTSTAAREEAKRQLEELLSLLCTSILIGGEQLVREFPSQLYVPVLTDILVAAHVPAPATGDGVNPLMWDMDEVSAASMSKPGKSPHKRSAPKQKEKAAAPQGVIPYSGFQMASPIELLTLRAVALIAGDVPRGCYAMRTAKSPMTIPVLAAYLSDPEFLIINDELTEELLKCFLHLTLIAHETCVEASVPRRIVELLLVVEQHHLRLLCMQVLSNMLARAREADLEDVWSPVLALLFESLTSYLVDNSLQPESSMASVQRRSSPAGLESEGSTKGSALNNNNTSTSAANAATVTTSAAASAFRTLTPKEMTLLQHYLECIVHALDRLFVQVAALECHARLIEQFVEVCVQLLRTSLHVSPATDGETLRTFALSPLITVYLINPSFAVPLFVRQRVWDAVCGCMLTLVERKQLEPMASRQAQNAETGAASTTATAAAGGAAAAAVSSSALADESTTSNAISGNGDGEDDESSAAPNENASTLRHGPAIASGPVLTTDVTTIPFIADELRLLPLLEFLLVILPCARRGHSHSDYRNTTGPYYRWTWEDDFHNEMECNEGLGRRLERVYQQTRTFRSHGRYAMTHGKQRVFYADFLSKTYVSERKMYHSLHRRPLLAGFVHDTRNALLHGCACCAAEPDPLFSTWTNRSNLQLRTADPVNGGYMSDTATNADTLGDDSERAPARSSSAPSLRPHTHTSDRRQRAANTASPAGDAASVHSSGSNVRRSGHHSRPAAAAAAAATPDTSLMSGRARRGHTADSSAVDESAVSRRSGRSEGSPSTRLRRQVAFRDAHHDGAADLDNEELSSDDADTLFDDDDSALQPAPPAHTFRLGLMMCSCDRRDATAQHRVPVQRRRAAPADATSSRSQSRPPLTITVLPVEVMLEDPIEKLQNDPGTRKAYLGKDVLSHLVPTMMPALLSVLDNCVNPLVARHSLTLLLRCLSLCADLRTQVTGETIETGSNIMSSTSNSAKGTNSSSNNIGGSAPASKDKAGKKFLSFRKWIKGSSTAIAARWQRTEWQTTQTALQCFLTSLRDVFVGLYMTEGVHITAARQEVFGPMKDDLLMVDELARVHLASDFNGFQLSLPSEQLMTTADAMILLLRLFPKPKPIPASPLTSVKNTVLGKKGKPTKRASLPAQTQAPPPPPSAFESSVHSFTSFEESTHDTHELSSSPIPPVSGGAGADGAVTTLLNASMAGAPTNASSPTHDELHGLTVSAGGCGNRESERAASPFTSPLVPGKLPRPPAAPTPNVQRTLSRDSTNNTHASAANAHAGISSSSGGGGSNGVAGSARSGTYKAMAPPLSNTPEASATNNINGNGGVFTVHQVTLLLNYAREIVNHGTRVCAAAAQIERSMQYAEFKTVVVLGSSDVNGNAAGASLHSKELVLRTTPASACPYHFTFSYCTVNFFDASVALLQALTELGGDVHLRAPATFTGSDATGQDAATAYAERLALAAASMSVSDKTSAPASPDANGGGSASRAGESAPSAGSPVSHSSIHHHHHHHHDHNHQHPATTSSGGGGGDAVEAPTTPSQGGPAPPSGAAESNPAPSHLEEDLPVDVRTSLVPETIDMQALYEAVNVARADTAGPYRRLAPALRALLTFYDYCKEREIEFRAVMIELPSFVLNLAEELQHWHSAVMRAREDEPLLLSDVAASPMSNASRSMMSGSISSHTRLDSQVRGKILRLVSELGATVSRDLGLASLDMGPPIIVKQPCSFVKRAKRMRTFGSVRHLAWRPLLIAMEQKAPDGGTTSTRTKTSDGDSKGRGRGSYVTVHNMQLPIITAVKIRRPSFAVLPNTTMGTLAVAVAKHLQLTASPSPKPSATKQRTSQRSPAAVPLHAVQDRQHSSDAGTAPTLAEASPHLTSQEIFEDGAGASSRAVSPSCILFFINNEPMISPLTTVIDGLATYADTGYSLRSLVTMDRQSSDSEEMHRNKILVTLPTLPFWVAKHDIRFVVLEEPLPMALRTGDLCTSLWSTCTPRRCGCAGMDPPFFCSPKHLFEVAPTNGSVALYAAVSSIARSEIADATTLIDSNQRRLSSAVVHQLYHQLNMFMLPPLLYGSGIGPATRGMSVNAVATARKSRPNMTFPVASYALWAHSTMFSMEMRVSILRFFISAQRSLTVDQCRHLLQAHQNLLVRRPAGEPSFGVEETRHGEGNAASSRSEVSDKRLEVVGLEWLSEEVLRKRRVTLTVDRRHILQSAEQLFTLATCTFTLDVAFKGEAGIGNGPAMEFYELVAEELLKPKHGLFRTEEVPASDDAANASAAAAATSRGVAQPPRRRSCNPLYPAARQTPQTLRHWELLGLLLGRLLMMGETTSLSFHPLLLRRLLGEDIMKVSTVSATGNLDLLDPTLAASLQQLTKMSATELEACDLYFTIPVSEADGWTPGAESEVPMIPHGETRQVTRDNVDEYVARLRSFYLQTVPDLALLHLRRGLQHVVNPLYLELFTAAELGRLLGSSVDAKVWESREQFARCIEAGHGYHRRSDVVQYLLDVVPQWSARLQHSFLKFVTGSSSVPYGGLTQTIKVVRRDIDATAAATDSHASPTNRSTGANPGASGTYGATVSEAAMSATTQNQSFALNTAHDSTLPTVSTCFLYLKLPQYSSKAVLEERLRFAVSEGSNFFSLT